MITPNPTRAAAILLACFFVFGPAATSSAQAGCVGARGWTYTGPTGLAVAKDKAKKRARRRWATRVTLKYGYKFNHWGSAKNTAYSCDKKHGTWRCKAKGNPCTLHQAQ